MTITVWKCSLSHFVYRCLVRAKVAAIRSLERQHDNYAKNDLCRMQKYCDMALQHSMGRTPSLRAGHDVILDAAYLRFSQRQHAREIAADCNAGPVIIHAYAPVNILRDRISTRAGCGHEPSEADLAVLEFQLKNTESLTPEEQRETVSWDSCAKIEAEDLSRRLRHSVSWSTASRWL